MARETDARATGVTGAGPRTAASARPVPERSDDFAHLDLDRLRAYRTALSEEENRVSYWRRIIQARLDIVVAGASVNPADVESLRGVLAGSRTGGNRTSLITIVPADDDIPLLPDLTELWERDPIRGDDEHNAALAAELADAERELSEYRTALHRRIAAATGELIARYREEPALALTALPEMPVQRRRAV
jgi:hypothetical protein